MLYGAVLPLDRVLARLSSRRWKGSWMKRTEMACSGIFVVHGGLTMPGTRTKITIIRPPLSSGVAALRN
jgi:hypothetical protein